MTLKPTKSLKGIAVRGAFATAIPWRGNTQKDLRKAASAAQKKALKR